MTLLQPLGCLDISEPRPSMNFLNLISYFPQYSRCFDEAIDLESLTR